MKQRSNRFAQVCILLLALSVSAVLLASCFDGSDASGSVSNYSRTPSADMQFSNYSDYIEWLLYGDSSSDAESKAPFDAPEFLAGYVASFSYYRELVNSRLETVPSDDPEDAPFERVISDHYDTRANIEAYLSSFMTPRFINSELEFLVSPTTADGSGPPLYRFVNGATWMNTGISHSFYPGTWDIESAEPVYILETGMRISFIARENGKDYHYSADFVLENGVWLLDSIF